MKLSEVEVTSYHKPEKSKCEIGDRNKSFICLFREDIQNIMPEQDTSNYLSGNYWKMQFPKYFGEDISCEEQDSQHE